MNPDRFWNEELSGINQDVLFSVRTGDYLPGAWLGWQDGGAAPTGTPILRTYEGHGERLLLLRSPQ